MENILIKSKLYDYTVEFLDEFSTILDSFEETITYVIDSNVYRLYQEKFLNLDKDKIFIVEAIEENKNMDTVLNIVGFWKEINVRKNWKVVCIGGGIIQDVTTIASNLYLRNMEWYLFPTTLLAMCDSCIGGKGGVNFGEFKNQLGVFYPPKKVFIAIEFLDTLCEIDHINGWGELLKFSLTQNSDFFNEVMNVEKYIPCEKIGNFIYQGLMVKKNIIEKDEFEGDLRRILNYGHTFGHALESYTKNEISHGMAVIWGMDVVNYIALKKKLIDTHVYETIKSLIKKNFIKKEIKINDPHKLFSIIKTDKKVRNNTIFLALLCGATQLTIVPVEINEEFEELFIEYLSETSNFYDENQKVL